MREDPPRWSSRRGQASRSSLRSPYVAARSLSIRRSQTIGIVLPDVHGEFFSEVIRGIDLAARAQGYHILVSGSHSDRRRCWRSSTAMRGRVDGLVVMAPDLDSPRRVAICAASMPVVLLNSSTRTDDAITIDNYGGARAMMQHLIALGHRRIAFIKGPPHNADARERLRGYRHAMAVSEPGTPRWRSTATSPRSPDYAAGAPLLARTPAADGGIRRERLDGHRRALRPRGSGGERSRGR